jgi:hypothetical protein
MGVKEGLAKAGLELCDEIEKVMSEGDTGQALIPATRLYNRIEELTKGDPDYQRACAKVVSELVAYLLEGDLHFARYGLWAVRLLLAEELPDNTLLQALLNSPPQIGAA